MDLKDERRIAAPREAVFAALNDPDILAQAIPGCESLEMVSDTEFAATVTAKVGPVRAKFKGQVTLSDLNPPEATPFRVKARAVPPGSPRAVR